LGHLARDLDVSYEDTIEVGPVGGENKIAVVGE
jgi:hypothetical protein